MSLFTFVKTTIPILDVITQYMQLKPAGHYWKGSCPFHSEKDASFTVSPDKQIFYCFGCHTSGDTISFIAKIENFSQIEAVKHLIERYQLTIPPEFKDAHFAKSLANADQKEAYYRINQAMAQWAHKQLLANQSALTYLTQRGLEPSTMQLFMIGYMPGGVTAINAFIKEMNTQNILLKDLLHFGLFMEGKSHIFSPFEERILFPIKDQIGRFCGFGGRIFRQGDQRAKYLNSKESEWFIKGHLLFGLDEAKKTMQKEECAFLVEGYMDCVSMVQHGYKNTIATLGTACTLDHLKVLARLITTLYLVYDGDKAGQAATLRIAQLCWQVNLELKVIVLPEKEDPASFLQNKGDLNTLIATAKDIFSFFIDKVGYDFLQKPLATKMTMAQKIIEVIASLDNELKQDLLLQQASQIMQVPTQTLKKMIKKEQKQFKTLPLPLDPVQPSHNPQNIKTSDQNGENEISSLEEKIFSATINNVGRDVPLDIDPALISYFSPKMQTLLQKFKAHLTDRSISFKTFSTFLDTLEEDERRLVVKISLKSDSPITLEAFEQLMLHFCKYHWRYIVKDMTEEIRKAEQYEDHQRLNELLVKFSKLKQGIQARGLI